VNVSYLIARRYFSSKNTRNIISIIANISMVGVAIGTLALIIVLSVFNGLEDMVRAAYSRFDPHLKVVARKGKSFAVTPEMLAKIKGTAGVSQYTEVIEDNALLRYDERQMVVKIKGASPNYYVHNRLDSAMIDGRFELVRKSEGYGVVGEGVQRQLAVNISNRFQELQFLYPKNKKKISLDPTEAFNVGRIKPGGVFRLERQYDDQYVFVPLAFAQELMGYEGRRTSLEVEAQDPDDIPKVQRALKRLLGPEFRVLNSDEQHVALLRAVKVEKAFVFVTFTFILLIASLNIFFSLSMLVIDKKKDVAILQSMGAEPRTIRNIFLIEGTIVAFAGAFTGLVIGVGVCWAQKQFGLVSMGRLASGLDQPYPVKMLWENLALTVIAIIVITITVSIRPANQAANIQIRDQI
jgi:lipoprotein-releasing system permease protein